jgi:hypothetical protein
MKNLILIFALALPSFGIAAEPIDFDPQPTVDSPETMPVPKSLAAAEDVANAIATESLKSKAADEFIERDIDELFRRVEALETTKIDAKQAEAIAEDVFKRLSIVVNKADGGQELKTFDVPISDGTVIKTTLGPGQSFGSLVDPVTGQTVFFGKPTMMSLPSQSHPVEQFQFQNFEVRQTAPTSDGYRSVNVKVGNGPVTKVCQMVGNQMVCSQVSQPMVSTTTVKQQTRPARPAWRGLFGNRR